MFLRTMRLYLLCSLVRLSYGTTLNIRSSVNCLSRVRKVLPNILTLIGTVSSESNTCTSLLALST